MNKVQEAEWRASKLGRRVDDLVATFEKIREADGRNAKQDLLDKFVQKGDNREIILKKIFYLVHDRYVRFGFTVPKKPKNKLGQGYGLTDSDLFLLLDLLERRADGKVSVSNTREAVEETLSRTAPVQYPWIAGIVNRRLPRCGIAKGTVKNMFPDLLSPWGVQLCSKFDLDSYEDGLLLVEPKLDGMRCVVLHKGGEWTALSRSGKPVYNIDHILQELENTGVPKDVVLDGEAWAGSFGETISYCRSSKATFDDAEEKVVLKIFDAIRRSEWDADEFTDSQLLRRDFLGSLIASHTLRTIEALPAAAVRDREELETVYDRHVEEGFEGSIVKDPTAPYSRGRTNGWSKLKPLNDEEFEIVEVVEGNGRLEGSTGALRLRIDGDLTSNVGTGFSDQQRRLLWENREEIEGLYCKVEFQEIAANGRLRFPRYVGVREAPGGDEVVLKEL